MAEPLFADVKTREKFLSPEKAVSEEIELSEEVNEIITSVPAWVVRSGTMVIFSVIAVILLISAFIQYPDIVKTSLKVNSLNSPKAVIAIQGGKLIRILIHNDQQVIENQPLAYIESTAKHEEVIRLAGKLDLLRKSLVSGNDLQSVEFNPRTLNLGELQSGYQSFYQSYILFEATLNGGHYLKQKAFLERDLVEIGKLKSQIISQQQIQQQEYANANQEYEAYKKLMAKGVISNNEFKQEENKYLASKYPLQQSATEILNNNSSLLAKQKEILELENTIAEQKAKFSQALNVIINDVDQWMMKYIIKAPFPGRVMFAGILQENQNVEMHQELFVVNPGNTGFFGELLIPQNNMGKIREGQRTLVKLRSYPFEQYGIVKGRISYLSDVAYKDSVFIAKVKFESFENKDPDHKVILKNGMVADAEIVTEESSLLQRFTRNITKMMNTN